MNEWPNRANEHLKSKFPNQRSAIVARLNEEYERVLYVQASTLIQLFFWDKARSHILTDISFDTSCLFHHMITKITFSNLML
jgi:hypothetical protein